VGGTFGASDAPGEGGLSAALSAMWSFEGPLAFGPMLFADDLGTRLVRIRDVNDGTDLGTAAVDHAMTFGAAWRLDAARRRGAWRPFGSATWGAYRFQGDQVGLKNRALTATGASVGAGVRWVPGRGEAATGVGLSIRHHMVFDERFGDYTSVGVDWHWPLGVRAPAAAGT
jgi:hypothetical protein